MSRLTNGGIKGKQAVQPNTTSAGGKWASNDQMVYRLSNAWPRDIFITINSSNQYNLASQNYTASTNGYYTLVPQTNANVLVQVWGAGGAGSTGTAGPSRGGAGGYVEGIVSLVAQTTYVFLIGEGGYGTLYNYPTSVTGTKSFPDGGASIQNEGYGQGGGGGSSRFGLLSQSGFNLTNSVSNYNNVNAEYLMIAGGGGGGSDYTYGWGGTAAGFGGGLTGSGGGGFYNGANSESLESTGKGGTQSAGGAAGTTPARLSYSQAGSKYYGGDGSGGAGGGGYYGGGGARGYYSMGGGGSGFIHPSLVSSGLFYTATAGQSTHFISPNPRNDRPSSTTGYGGETVAGVRYSSVGGKGFDGAIKISLV